MPALPKTRQNKFARLLEISQEFIVFGKRPGLIVQKYSPCSLRCGFFTSSKKIFPKPLDILKKTRYIIESEEKQAPIV